MKKIFVERNTEKVITAIPIVVLVTVYLVLIIRRAWVSDDAYITFRTIDNFINGYRLTWNVGERVQAFTHPLWMFVMSGFYYITREIYLTSMIVSLGVSLAGMVLYVMGVARGRYQAAFGIIVLCLSNAYIDYSTSGLENPMSHLLLVVFMVVYLKMKKGVKRVFWMSMVASLGLVNRMDMGLMYLPLLVVGWWESGNRKLGMVVGVLGQLPFIGWEIFSVIYYGFPFPNTAYAKLNTGIPSGELIQQGIYYIINSIQRDPITLVAVLIAVLAASIRGTRFQHALAIGALIYIVYVVKIGGDFMSGRFFAAPVLLAAIIFGQMDQDKLKIKGFAAISMTIVCIGMIAPVPTIRIMNPDNVPIVDGYSIADERLWYFPDTGLLRDGYIHTEPEHVWVEEGKRAAIEHAYDVVTQEGIGFFGYYAGPNVRIVDIHALPDPLLARIPAKRWVNWQIGHFERVIPPGYLLSLEDQRLKLADENLQIYYDKLILITRGSLLNINRLAEIWKMNTGQYDHLIDKDIYQYPAMVIRNQSDLQTITESGSPWDEEGNTIFFDSGLEINLDSGVNNADGLEIALDGNDNYQITYLNSTNAVGSQIIKPEAIIPGLVVYRIPIIQEANEKDFNRLRIFPLRWGGFTLKPARGDDQFSLGYLKFVDTVQ